MSEFTQVRDAALAKNPRLKTEYDGLNTRNTLIESLIRARKEQNITQKEMAARMGTGQSKISRLESGTYDPSLDFLIRAAASLNKRLEFNLR